MASASCASEPAAAAEWGEGAIWQETVAFAQGRLAASLAAHREGPARDDFPRDAWRCLGELGLPGLPVPEAFGGRGASALETAERLEALGYGCADNGLLGALSAHLLSCVVPLWQRGTDAQRRRWLPGLCSGELIAAHAATEPLSGSDVFAMQTRAVRRGDVYVLNGTKAFSLNAPAADLFILFATIDPALKTRGITAFVIERGTPGLRVGAACRKVGLATAMMGDLTLEDVEVPLAHRLADEGAGAMVFQLSMRWERSLIVATLVGTMRRLLEQCVTRARTRQQFGQAIGEFQSVSNRVADMKMRVELGRLALQRTATLLARGVRDAVEPSIAKLYISEAALVTAIDAMRIHGAAGYMQEREFGADVADALGMTLLSGTTDIQRQIIARYLGL